MIQDQNVHYYECHVTLDNVYNPDAAIEVGRMNGFKLSDLTKEDSYEKEFILTSRSPSYLLILGKMQDLKRALSKAGLSVQREKIEAIIHDSKG